MTSRSTCQAPECPIGKAGAAAGKRAWRWPRPPAEPPPAQRRKRAAEQTLDEPMRADQPRPLGPRLTNLDQTVDGQHGAGSATGEIDRVFGLSRRPAAAPGIQQAMAARDLMADC